MRSHICYYGDNAVLKAMLRNFDYIDLQKDPDYQFIPGDRYLVFEKAAYDVIVKHQGLHIGPRREGFHEMTKCPYMILRSGVIFKFRYLKYERRVEWLNEKQYNEMLPHLENIQKKLKDAELVSGISKKTGKPYFRMDFRDVAELDIDVLRFLNEEGYVKDPPKVEAWKVIRNSEDIEKSFKYFNSQDTAFRFGLDYETNGFPFDDPEFFHMGVGIADQSGICAYYDMEWMQSNEDKSHWEIFQKYYKEFCNTHQDEIYTYNVGFELRATYLLFKKMFRFHDAGVINKLEGEVEYYYSLKYTAMRFLGVASWDDDFEYLTDTLNELMNDESEDKVTLSNYRSHPLWSEIATRFPDELGEFDRLFNKYWGYAFKCIPSNILGKYCCMDSYYTMLLRGKSDELGYTEKAWNCFNMNMRMGAYLEINGAYIDEDYRKWMSDLGHHVAAYGSINIAKLFTKMELERLGDFELGEIPYVTNLLKRGLDFTDSKNMFRELLDETYEWGVNTNIMNEIFGQELTDKLLNVILNYYDKLTSSCFRARRVFSDLNEVILDHWKYVIQENLITFEIEGVQYQIKANLDEITYKYYLIQTKEVIDYYVDQLDPNVMVTSIKNLDGSEISMVDVESYAVSIFNFNSPVEIKNFLCNYYHRMRNVYFSLFDDKTILDNLKLNLEPPYPREIIERLKTDGSSALIRSEENLKLFVSNCLSTLLEFTPTLDGRTPDELNDYYNNSVLSVKELFKEYEKDGLELKLLHSLSNYRDFFKDLPIEDKYRLPLETAIDEASDILSKGDLGGWLFYIIFEILSEMGDEALDWLSDNLPDFNIEDKTVQGFAKFTHCYKSVRKYNKITSTYVEGMLNNDVRWCSPQDENGVCIERWNEEKPGNVLKGFCRYMVIQKKSGRWSASWHTIPSKNEVKRVVTTPPGYLMSYFDISGMEIRSLAYNPFSPDKFLKDSYEKGLDPYIELSKTINPDKPTSYHKEYRSDYKTTLLGSLYGMGSETMSERIGRTKDEAEQILTDMFTHMTGVKNFIEEQSDYVHANNGDIRTLLGNKINVSNESEDRWSRLSVNLVIQGNSAILMAAGFENIIQESYDNPDGPVIRPWNVVHDSAQNYFQSKYIFDIEKIYYKGLTEYLYNLIGIRYEFETLVGVNYFDLASMKHINDDILELSGSYKTLTSLCRKLKSDDVKFKLTSIKKKGEDEELLVNGEVSEKFKPSYWKSFLRMFYASGMEPVYEYDKSKFVLTIVRDE